MSIFDFEYFGILKSPLNLRLKPVVEQIKVNEHGLLKHLILLLHTPSNRIAFLYTQTTTTAMLELFALLKKK